MSYSDIKKNKPIEREKEKEKETGYRILVSTLAVAWPKLANSYIFLA